VSALAEGTARIVASVGGRADTAIVTVAGEGTEPPPTQPPPGGATPSSIAVSPVSVALQVGHVRQVSATVRGADGQLLPGHPVTWSTASAAIATVSESGLVTAVGPGTTLITATAGGQSTQMAVQVTEGPPSSGSLVVGRDTAGTVVGVDGTGVPLPGVLVVGDDDAGELAPLQAIVVFSLLDIPAGATIESAALPVLMDVDGVFGDPFALGALHVERTTAIELNLATPGPAAEVVATEHEEEAVVDVTAMVQAAIAAGDAYVAFRFRFPTTSNANGETDQLELDVGNLAVSWRR
jgi:hypothetical protein